MRFVRALVADDRRDDVLGVLSERDVDYVLTEEVSGRSDAVLIEFPLPTPAVDPVLSALRDAGLEDSYVVVASAETAATPAFETLQDRFETDTDDSVPAGEVRSRVRDLTPGAKTYYAMTVLSVLVATVGLVLDAPAVVVGSMVISPQVGASLTASVGLVFGERRLALDGLRSLVLGVVVAGVCAGLVGWTLRTTGFVPPALDVTTVAQIRSRTSPGLLAVGVGLCAGAAGAFGLSTDLPVSLVGVAVAAALIPAAAAVGIGLAWGVPSVAVGAAVLLAVNVLSITLAGGGALWFLGYRPDEWTSGDRRANLRADEVRTALVLTAVLLAAAVVPGGLIAQQTAVENDVNGAVQATVEDPAYDDLELLDVSVDFGGVLPGRGDRSVTVVVRRPADEPYPELAPQLRRRVAETTGDRVAVRVEFVDSRYAPAG